MRQRGLKCWLAAAWLALAAPAAGQVSATVERAAAAAPPRPAIWLLQDADTKIYLFGTFHLLPPGLRWRSAALNRVIKQADELVVETTDAPGEDALAGATRLFFADTPRPILERVPAGRREALAAAIAAGPIPTQAYDMMQTWAAAMVLGLAKLLGEYGVQDPSGAPGVEDVLEEVFRDAGKPIGSVESPVAILQALNALPAAVQETLLDAAIEEVQAAETGADTHLAAWLAGRAEQVEIRADDLPAELHDILLRRRNAAWTDWLAARLKRPGTVLFAVGAGHLAGPVSVQRMLAARGLEARRIDPSPR